MDRKEEAMANATMVWSMRSNRRGLKSPMSHVKPRMVRGAIHHIRLRRFRMKYLLGFFSFSVGALMRRLVLKRLNLLMADGRASVTNRSNNFKGPLAR